MAASALRRVTPVLPAGAVCAGMALLAAAVVAGSARAPLVAALLATTVLAFLAAPALRRWERVLSGMILVLLLIPIRRYQLPGNLPFDFDPYRLVVALLVAGWCVSLLVDKRVRLRRTAFDKPIALVMTAIVLSELANLETVSSLSAAVVKKVTFFSSFVLVFYVLTSVIRTRAQIDVLVRTLVTGGAVVGAFAIVERRTGYNVFDHLDEWFPVLQHSGAVLFETRAGRLRVFGSAEHPIALGAAFALLVPLAVYLLKTTRQNRWWVPLALFFFGALGTSSRTAVIMLVVAGCVILRLRPMDVKRLWPAVLPLVVAIHFVVPGALGTIRSAFFPAGGLVAEQTHVVKGNEALADNRLADIAPSLTTWWEQPLFGQGFGTRLVGYDVEVTNARILDDEWLASLLEVGIVGILGLGWLVGRSVRRLSRLARSDPGADGWLAAALAASIASLAVGMFTFDAFSFTQIPFLFFLMLGLGACLLALQEPARRLAAQPLK
jgi:hypothetical protein